MATRRKHLDLRRQGSFSRLQRLPSVVDNWFYTDERLHDAIEDFAKTHCHLSPNFAPVALGAGDARQALATSPSETDEHDHQVQILMQQFVDGVIDKHLTEFREQHNVDEREFEAILRLSFEEESEGKHFYRWAQVSTVNSFLVLMRAAYASYASTGSGQSHEHASPRPATFALLSFLQSQSMDARNLHRRKTLLRPLLNRWCPETFQAILELLQSSSKEFPSQLDVPRKKNLARWKNRLSTPVLGPDGVYGPPPRDEESWLQYLERYCEMMPDTEFESFVAFAEAYIAAVQHGEEGEELKDRRAAWLCFQQLDPLHTGTVYLEDLLDELSRLPDFFATEGQQRLLLKKLRIKLEAEDKNNRRVSSSAPHSSHALVANVLEKLNSASTVGGKSMPTLAPHSDASGAVGSHVSSQSAEMSANKRSDREISSPTVAPTSSVLLDVNQFFRALEYVYAQHNNQAFRDTFCRTFRLFVTALHKAIASHIISHGVND